ncbi:MAG: hypothetical protein J6P45_03455 [Lachnospiraceae bacterium]|nr:hypothetical protein [Lachnospiraceae bacterium]
MKKFKILLICVSAAVVLATGCAKETDKVTDKRQEQNTGTTGDLMENANTVLDYSESEAGNYDALDAGLEE